MQEAAKRYGQLRADDDILDNAIPVYPDDLAGHYRFGLKPEEVEKMNFETKTIHALSFAHASQREINQFRIKRAIEKWGRFPGDTGSDEVQAAVLTEKMFYLAVHFKHNPNDKARKRMFLMLLARRQRLLRKLKIEKTDVYYALLRDLQIPDTARSYTTGFLPGLSIPKQANLSKQKRQRLLKGKVICQRAHDLAARRPKAKA
jgi:ribosomal protein S15